MSTEEIRTLIKIHIQAAESCGKMEAAMALLGLLDAIDVETTERRRE